MSQFTGLMMPVFSAFGWAGQEAAVKYALSQLELFVGRLHAALPQEFQSMFPHFGVEQDSQMVYISSDHKLESEPYFTFQARPLSFEMTFHMTDEMYIGKMLSVAERQFDSWYTAVRQLGDDWTIRIQQMEVPEGGTPSHYQDLYKGPVNDLNRDTANEIVNRAVYLHSEEKWITPLYFTLRLHSETVAAMGPAVIPTYREYISRLLPLLQFVYVPRKSAGQGRAAKTPKTRTPKAPTAPLTPPVVPFMSEASSSTAGEGNRSELFRFTSELKPLHIRKGFVNLQPRHWHYFAVGTRMETRPVIVRYGSKRDTESAVWHLLPDDQTRIVLGPPVQSWLEENFAPDDAIEVVAHRLNDDKIEITLSPVSA